MSNEYTDKYSPQFQTKILALLVRDKDFLVRYDDIIQLSYFTLAEHKTVCKIIKDYFYKYKSVPTFTVVTQELEKKIDKLTKLKPNADWSDTVDLVQQIFTMDVEDLEYIRDEAKFFAQRQAVFEAMTAGIDVFNTGGNYEIIKKKLEEALKIGVDKNDLGSFYIKDYRQRLEDRLHKVENSDKIRFVFSPTLTELCNGGMGKGELWVVLAPVNRGKTSFLLNIGVSGLLQDKKGIFYSIDDPKELIENRLDAVMTNIGMREVNISFEAVENKMKGHSIKYKNSDLLIKEYHAKSISVNTIISHLSLLEGYHNFVPDFIIIDYADIMKPVDNYELKRDQQSEIYRDLKRLAQIYKIPVITACQSNSEGFNKEVVDLTNAGESREKTHIAHGVLSLNEDKEALDNNKLIVYTAKNKEGKKWDKISLTFDRSKAYINEEMDDIETNRLLFI